MKVNKIILKTVLSLTVIIGVTSCSNKPNSNSTSRGTGWNMVKTRNGFSNASSHKTQETGPGLVFVEGGTFTRGLVQDDVMHDWNNVPTQQHVMSFYMDETEVTNLMYLEYLEWLKKVYPPTEEKYKNIYEGASPDTLVWRNRLGYNETMTNNYLRHPAYANYPVVGVNWVQAVEFSRWRTDRVNENVLEKNKYLKKNAKVLDVSAESTFSTETYLAAPTLTFGGNEEVVLKGGQGGRKHLKPSKSKKASKSNEEAPVTEGEAPAVAEGKKGRKSKKNNKSVVEDKNVYAQRSTGILLPEYRLPTESEWEYAAAADVGQREYNIYKGQKKYPWSGSYTRSAARSNRGFQLANFKQGNGDYGGIAGWSDDGADITNEVKKYPANDFGLYDMAGNVAEWVADVYRPIVDNETNDFNYFRGNIYTKNKIGKDGKLDIITINNIVYDTLSNGKLVAINLPGEIAQVPVNDEETYLRQNFNTSNNINFRDGDKQSSKYYKFAGSADGKEKTSDKDLMYNSPKNNVKIDSLGNMERKFDKSNKRTTMINDAVRVYKGGSWRDRAYWLDPAQRRFFPQDMSTDYIGFRCAMSRVGSKSNTKRSPRN